MKCLVSVSANLASVALTAISVSLDTTVSLPKDAKNANLAMLQDTFVIQRQASASVRRTLPVPPATTVLLALGAMTF